MFGWIISAFVGLIAIFALMGAIGLARKAIRFVPQGFEDLIERFGKYSRTLQPGFALINPFFEKPIRVDIKERKVDLSPKQQVICADNVPVGVDGILFYKVTDAYAATYKVRNLDAAILAEAQTALRSIIGGMQLDHLLSDREKINAGVLEQVNKKAADWGVIITSGGVKDIDPPADVTQSMERQMKAERDRRADVIKAEGVAQSAKLQAEGQRAAAIATAEGLKQATVLAAEARRDSALLDAEARERTGQAEANAIKSVNDAIAEGDDKGFEFYIAKMKYAALVDFAKELPVGTTTVVPTDFSAITGAIGALKGVLGAGAINNAQ
ncbi:MAG: SPFH domain-containing protein [Rickettsiales bacterium]